MSSQVIKSTSSSSTEVVDEKFYEGFLETFVKVCGEEDVNKVPQIVIVDKGGVQITEPETISRKLYQIAASLNKANVHSAIQETVTKQDVQKVTPKDNAGIRIAVNETVPKDMPKSSQGAPEDKVNAALETELEHIVCRLRKEQLKIVYGRPETPTAMSIKSSRIEFALLKTIGRCITVFPTISELRLENCRLRPEDVFLIAIVLRETDTIKQLILDNNPLGDMHYSCLLKMSKSLLLLSLCGCQIGDIGVAYISEALEHTEEVQYPPLRLNLCSNRISCKGAQLLANMLRTNRVLISLSLSGNLIENTGAIALAEVFQKFQLRQDECMERRGRYFTQNLRKTSNVSVFDDLHPFLRELERQNGISYSKGNFTLLHLNLSYNSIGLPGLLAFHQAVLYQESVLQTPDKGVLTLCLRGNLFPEDRPEHEEMLKIFRTRLILHRNISKTSSLESSRSGSKTSGLGSSKTSFKSRELENVAQEQATL